MEIFNLTLTQMLMMFTLILVGFFLRKKNIVPENSYVTIAKLETFVLSPALNCYNQLTKCTVENFLNNWKLMFYGLALVLVAIAIACPASALFIKHSTEDQKEAYQRNIYKYALTFGNYGFMGNFIVLGIWGSDMFYKYTMFTFFIALFCSGWGLYILIPKQTGGNAFWKNLKKGLTAPPMLGILIGCVCGLCNLSRFFPEFFMKALSNASNCMGPIAMILAGVVIGGYHFKSLLTKKKVYVVTFLRLIVIPAIFVLILKTLGTSDEILSFVLIAFATPIGMNTIVYPGAYGGDTKTGASMTMISHVLSVITIPLMYLIFVVLM